MSRPISRRKLLQAGAAASASLLIGPAAMARTYSANEKIRFVLVGIGGMGGKGVGVASGEQIVAAADVNMNHAGGSVKAIKDRFRDAKIYSDYRKLFDEQKHVNAAWVATPDHSHFPAGVRALDAGLALYCEKPLCHDIYEARKLRELAKAKKVATQMGNQGHSGKGVRLLCEWIWQGSLGDVTEAHVRPPYNQMDFGSRTAGQPERVPPSLDWNLWQGLVKEREFRSGIHPAAWRGWLDYGTGLLGDWFCHNADGAVWALKLYEAENLRGGVRRGRAERDELAARRLRLLEVPQARRLGSLHYAVEFRHVQRQAHAADGRSPAGGRRGRSSQRLLRHEGHRRLRLVDERRAALPREFHAQVGRPKTVLPRVKGGHEADFLNAIRSGGRSSADFDYSARLTEIMLLGNVASRVREKLVYDFREGKFTNSEKANALLQRGPRKGWEFGYPS